MTEKNKELSIEKTFEELDGIIEKMQSEELGLEDTFELYKRGIELVGSCNKKIEKIQCDIELINKAEDMNG